MRTTMNSQPANLLQVHEVAVATSIAYILLILPTSCFSKIRNRREINNDWAT